MNRLRPPALEAVLAGELLPVGTHPFAAAIAVVDVDEVGAVGIRGKHYVEVAWVGSAVTENSVLGQA